MAFSSLRNAIPKYRKYCRYLNCLLLYLSSFLTGHPDERCAGDDEPRPVDAAVQIVHDGGALQVECADGRISSL